MSIRQCCQHVIRRCRAVMKLGPGDLRATATIEIDATAPLSQVVRHLENLT